MTCREEQVKILAYKEDIAAPEFLSFLWTQLSGEDPAELAFFWADGQQMNRNTFIRFFAPIENRVLFLPVFLPDQGDPTVEHIGGLMWIDQGELGHRAFAHFFFFKKFRGNGFPFIAIRKALEIGFTPPYSLGLILGQLHADNHKAVAFAQKVGFDLLGVVPKLYRHSHDGQFHDGVVCYLTSEKFFSTEVHAVASPPGER